MTFLDAVSANCMQSVRSPAGQLFRKNAMVRRVENKNAIWTSEEITGVWHLGTVVFTARVALHGDGAILLHPETGENFFVDLIQLSDTLVSVSVSTKELPNEKPGHS